MKNKLALIVIISLLIVSLCYNTNDDSKVIATVGDVTITQRELDIMRSDSTYGGQEKVFSDKEVIDDMIADKLFLIKAKELNIKMSDKEVIEAYKGMLMSMSSRQYVKGDENKIDKNSLEGLRNILIIQKTKIKLGSDVDKTLKKLRQNMKIIYYN